MMPKSTLLNVHTSYMAVMKLDGLYDDPPSMSYLLTIVRAMNLDCQLACILEYSSIPNSGEIGINHEPPPNFLLTFYCFSQLTSRVYHEI